MALRSGDGPRCMPIVCAEVAPFFSRRHYHGMPLNCLLYADCLVQQSSKCGYSVEENQAGIAFASQIAASAPLRGAGAKRLKFYKVFIHLDFISLCMGCHHDTVEGFGKL